MYQVHKDEKLQSSEVQQQAHINDQQTISKNNGADELLASQLYSLQYQPFMLSVCCQNKNVTLQILHKHNFVNLQNQHKDTLSRRQLGNIVKICVKTNWESVTYRVNIGNFESNLTIFKFNISEKNYIPNVIAKGQFGKVSYMKYEGKEYALKNIHVKPNDNCSLQNALRQVFIMKMASCLKIGPSFYNISGYDAIVFEDCLQVAMQFCQIKYDKAMLNQQLFRKDLYKSLKILHAIQLYHGDIKPDNIGWSKSYQKFVLLDFGFSRFLLEPLGFKTTTRFQGTYNYCSQQMKKLYFLRQSNKVDLYYNDLCCLKATHAILKQQLVKLQAKQYNIFQDFKFLGIQKQMKQQSLQSENQIQKLKEGEGFQIQKQLGLNFLIDDTQGDYSDLMNFFNLKFKLFNDDFVNLEETIMKQNKLVYTFRKILYDQIKEQQNYKSYQQIVQIYRKYSQMCEQHSKSTNKITKYDALMYQYLLGKSNNNNSVVIFQGIIQMKKCYDFLTQVWGNQMWAQTIFSFLCASADLRTRIFKDKMKDFLKDLFKFLRNKFPICQEKALKRMRLSEYQAEVCSMVHDVFIVFFEYFDQLNRVDILQKIVPYFIVLNDDYNREQMEIVILRYYQNDYKNYLMKNFEYFLGRNLSSQYQMQIQKCNYVQNVENIYNQMLAKYNSQQIQADEQNARLIELIRKTLYLMKSIKLIQVQKRIEHINPQFQVFISNFFTDSIFQQLGQDFHYIFQNYMLPKKHLKTRFAKLEINIGYNDTKLKSKYFEACYIRALQFYYVAYLGSTDNNYSREKLFSERTFPFYNTTNSIQNFETSLCQHFLQLNKIHNFNFSLFNVITAISFINNEQKASAYLLNLIYHFKLQRITKISHLRPVYQGLSKFLGLFGLSSRTFTVFDFKSLKNSLSSFILQFLDWTWCFRKQISPNIELNQHYFGLQQFDFYHALLRGKVHMLLGQCQKSIDAFMTLLSPLKRAEFNITNFHLCQIYLGYPGISQSSKQKITSVVMQMHEPGNFKKQSKFQYLSSNWLICLTAVKIMLDNNNPNRAFEVIKMYLKAFNINNSSFVDYYVRPTLQFYVKHCPQSILVDHFVNLAANLKIGDIVDYPGLSILIFQLLLKCELFPTEILILIKRTIILCAFGFQIINNTSLIWAKKYIKYLVVANFNKNKHVPLQCMLFYKNYSNFLNLIKGKLNKLSRKKDYAGCKVRQKVQILLKNIFQI